MTPIIEIIAIGYNFNMPKQQPATIRPNGIKDYIFAYHISPSVITINNQIYNAEPNACFIITPETPLTTFFPETEIDAHFLHFNGTHIDTFLKMTDLPLNTVFYPRNVHSVFHILEEVQNDSFIMDPLIKCKTSSLLIYFFIKFSQLYHINIRNKTKGYRSELIHMFNNARSNILKAPEREWTLAEMAALVNLSESRFSLLYREYFGVSPKKDLLNARMERARSLLLNTRLTVSEISEMVGYSNQFHFIRLFHKYTGITPGKYFSSAMCPAGQL